MRTAALTAGDLPGLCKDKNWGGGGDEGDGVDDPTANGGPRTPARRRPPARRTPPATVGTPTVDASSSWAGRASGGPTVDAARALGRGVCGGGGRPPTATHGAGSGGGLLSTGALRASHKFTNRSRPPTTLSTSSVSPRPGRPPPPVARGGGRGHVVPFRRGMRARAAPHPKSATPPRPRAASYTHRWAGAGGRDAARARFNSRPWLWVFATPQWPPQPRVPATAPLAAVDAAWRHGRAAPGGSKLAIGGWARARGLPRRPGETPWRATVAAWPPPQPSLPPAPTATPRDPNPARPVRRLAVGDVAPLVTQTPTLSPRRPSPFRSGAAHRHDSDVVGASLWCALFCLFLGGRACAAVSRVDAPLHHSQPSSRRSSQRARRLRYAFLVGRGRDGRPRQKNTHHATPRASSTRRAG